MHKGAFEALKETFMHFSGIPHQVLTTKTNYELIDFSQILVWEDLRHA